MSFAILADRSCNSGNDAREESEDDGTRSADFGELDIDFQVSRSVIVVLRKLTDLENPKYANVPLAR